MQELVPNEMPHIANSDSLPTSTNISQIYVIFKPFIKIELLLCYRKFLGTDAQADKIHIFLRVIKD